MEGVEYIVLLHQRANREIWYERCLLAELLAILRHRMRTRLKLYSSGRAEAAQIKIAATKL